SDAELAALRRGVLLDGRPAVPVTVEVPGPRFRVPGLATAARRSTSRPSRGARSALTSRDSRLSDGAWLRIVLREGRNREVRRMLEAVGHPVERLIRTRVGTVQLGNLRPGAYRDLTRAEVRALGGGSGVGGRRTE